MLFIALIRLYVMWWFYLTTIYSENISFYWVGMLLVSRSGLVEEDAIEVFRYYGVHLSSSFLM
jgi:hypothetical protein